MLFFKSYFGTVVAAHTYPIMHLLHHFSFHFLPLLFPVSPVVLLIHFCQLLNAPYCICSLYSIIKNLASRDNTKVYKVFVQVITIILLCANIIFEYINLFLFPSVQSEFQKYFKQCIYIHYNIIHML